MSTQPTNGPIKKLIEIVGWCSRCHREVPYESSGRRLTHLFDKYKRYHVHLGQQVFNVLLCVKCDKLVRNNPDLLDSLYDKANAWQEWPDEPTN